MKKTFTYLYYIIFVAGLWLLNRHFQDFASVNGLLVAILVGLIIAFVAKLIFKTITKMLIFFIIIVGVVIFLFSIEFFVVPIWLQPIFDFITGVN